VDHSVLFDQLHEASPRPAVRDFLVRATMWAARAGDWTTRPEPPDRSEIPGVEELIGEQPVGRPAHDTAVLDLPDDAKNDWPAISDLLHRELERADLEIEEPTPREGKPLLDSDTLERAGIVVIGSGRDGEQVHWSEPLALGWFFNRGGRILAIPHAAGGTMTRMVGFNELLTQLRIAVSLERDNGRMELEQHSITDGIRMPSNGLPLRKGARVWAPLTEPLVTVRGAPAAAAWQLGEGRIVIIDGQLLLPQRKQEEPYDQTVRLLSNAIDWLMGEE
jgi:hypothetical protein